MKLENRPLSLRCSFKRVYNIITILIIIFIIWMTSLSLYFSNVQNINQDKQLRSKTSTSTSISTLAIEDIKINNINNNLGNIYSNIWIIKGKNIKVYDSLTSNSLKIIKRLYSESIVIGELNSDENLKIIYPIEGWINLKPNNIFLTRIENILIDNNNNNDTNSKLNEDSCSNILTIIPKKKNLEQLLSWQNQWPIGNGKFGTLVGGSFYGNILPFSHEGFYVSPKFIHEQDQQEQQQQQQQQVEEEEEAKREEDIRQQQNLNLYFTQSRKHIVDGEFELSQNVLSSAIRRQPMGMFQYIYDLTLVFHPQELLLLSSKSSKSNNNINNNNNNNLRRISLVEKLQNIIFGKTFHIDNGYILSESSPSLNNFHVVYERNFLNTKEGISTSIHLISKESSNNKKQKISEYHIHSRTWFASSIDDVIVGKLNCKSILVGNKKLQPNCLDMLLMISRQGNRIQQNHLIRFVSWNNRRDYTINGIEKETTTPLSFLNEKFSIFKSNNSNNNSILIKNLIAVSISLTSSKENHPNVEVCGVISCTNGYTLIDQTISCQGSESSTLIFHIIKQEDSNIKELDNLRNNCWLKIENAITLGYQNLLDRHKKIFSSSMSETNLCIHQEFNISKDSICSRSYLGINDKIECLRKVSILNNNNGININNYIDIQLINSAQLFSKYLLYSSSQRSVSNLQGLWADGPTSAWNGDYHLNINLQMIYWPIYSMGISKKLISSLIKFIQNIVIHGKKTAKQLYGCPGWVIHAFTDNTLDTNILGDLEWSLCVTCGAWLALHLWDYISYEDYNENFIYDTFLPIFRSLSEFYIKYMFEGPDGFMHTGPTTSPENSYQIKENGIETDIFSQVAISPAFDMSILRQSCNAYSVAIQWLLNNSTLILNKTIFSSLQEDINIAKSFCSIVYHMKNHGNPSVDINSNTILEYPVNKWKSSSSSSTDFIHKLNINKNEIVDNTISANIETSEIELKGNFDISHRHFSSLHWLYPGTFIPSSKNIINAAKKTLYQKSNSGGGHTGWSASWESCLWSRLREPEYSWKALVKILSRYTSTNLLGLHPSLTQFNPSCRTCFKHEIIINEENNPQEIQLRGLKDENGAVFQMDANSGYFAALSEMILQSHIPGVINLIPSLPKQLSHSGIIYNVLTRGNIKVSMKWISGKVMTVILKLSKWHPWLSEINEHSLGFFDSKLLSSTYHLFITSPNKLRYIQGGSCSIATSNLNTTSYNLKLIKLFNDEDQLLQLQLHSFPCTIFLCSFHLTKTQCDEYINELISEDD